MERVSGRTLGAVARGVTRPVALDGATRVAGADPSRFPAGTADRRAAGRGGGGGSRAQDAPALMTFRRRARSRDSGRGYFLTNGVRAGARNRGAP